MLFIDWRALLGRKTLRVNFAIWNRWRRGMLHLQCLSDSCAFGFPHQIRVILVSPAFPLSIPLGPAIRYRASLGCRSVQ
ncbi:MAG: hypothetical protein FJW27_05075 [Acidimicrobiia bacterium]|nr:hypothetical protein [Acidimicrobiia bacterium]